MKKTFALALLLSGIAIAPAAATAVDDLKTETDKISGIYDKVLPTVVGATVFSMGATVLKRVIFS